MNASTIVLLVVVIVCTFSCGLTNEDGSHSTIAPSICRQPLVIGPCRAAKPRFGYDLEKKACTKFIYGGCLGNDNNFLTLEECRKACESPRLE